MGDSGDAQKMQRLLEMLALNSGDMSKLTQQQRKAFEEYKFWKTQPVARFDEKVEEEGPINPPRRVEDVRDEPYPLLEEFEWRTMDITTGQDLEDVFVLLNENYIEDKDSTFRFNYTREFFNWALKPPGWRKEWHVGVRVRQSGRLVAFISAVPTTLEVRGREMKSVEINFLCIHKKLRSKRLAPILIKEITRRVNKCDIWHALYSAGIVLPSPISTCRYTHRPLNWSKLFDVGFTALPANATKTQMLAKYTLPKKPLVEGLRPMTDADVDGAFDLFNRYQKRFELIQTFDKSEFRHWFLGNEETPSVIYSYVVQNSEGKITDFVSFYSLPFTILKNPLHKELGIGYLFYYASDADFDYEDRYDPTATELLRKRLTQLINDVCILARDLKMDVFNALTSQDNALFLEDLKFGPGDGFLNFYLFNYRANPIRGGLTEDKKFDAKNRSNQGVVML
ncbi:AAR077Cp [Eremothecium gossypii ATCC 10895]|uniref:Glycylpeptide N-tetradecanoyltransferase n=1 Tax=Eremothecium gossypii (strain ATCC 10895 / CBS 109.51 / FGSC 9923 / NRRL Y-1056) TaxID=284811 RepID=NMT_EREGS|nr:AAR077Cp [Eremothecium gossypii ATCC 10895]Q75EK2.1 RecName: Full=Glycylpeptide N-tetradecanoyltransferase; AltName: Full=Myristoyl-CoA:protein N-myristoyltransferase; Short=NMT; AltName: Full=Peptide N-myristoyltransferase [Eremothecium gossypii ATCC 10895]AAS50442.1 AAR077Cp [Eremothecium gossypii ATCC 10895]AEY94728.1 FAAR077Cp [Eremothecium gossypii FDAG1]